MIAECLFDYFNMKKNAAVFHVASHEQYVELYICKRLLIVQGLYIIENWCNVLHFVSYLMKGLLQFWLGFYHE